jgi:indole-3-acetate monooxygenase
MIPPPVTQFPGGMISPPSAFLPEGVAGRIRKVAAAAEKLGRLHPDMLALAYERQWFRALVPKRYGGQALPLPAMVRLEEGLSWADGALGWTVTLCSGAGWFAGFFPLSSFPCLFGDPGLCLAGSGAASGRAEEVDGGYLINGRWAYASGAVHATAFTANCVLYKDGAPQVGGGRLGGSALSGAVAGDGAFAVAGNGDPLVRPFLFLREEVSVDFDWNAVGLVATGSHGFSIKDLLVPAERSFLIEVEAAADDDPLYRYPFLPLAEATLAANSSGLARHFLDCCAELGMGGGGLEAARLGLEERRAVFYRELDHSWERLGRGSPEGLSRDGDRPPAPEGVSRASRELAAAALYWVDKLYPQAGLGAARVDSEINRVWRDLHTASQHPLLR